MAIRARLTTAEELAARQREEQGRAGPGPGGATQHSEEEKAKRKERVAAAKDALKRSANLKGEHVAPARAALKEYLQHLNDRHQPNDDVFQALIEGPFRAPPKDKRDRRPFGGPGGPGGPGGRGGPGGPGGPGGRGGPGGPTGPGAPNAGRGRP
ncbi:MAG: hypothetical protein IPM45_03040 [Acidimicrobiales bacterium]|nr:hypothetical protein [Acidimicrobiales bacterium]